MLEMWDGLPGRYVDDPYIGRIFIFDRPQALIPGRESVRYVVIEYLPGQDPDEQEPEDEQCLS